MFPCTKIIGLWGLTYVYVRTLFRYITRFFTRQLCNAMRDFNFRHFFENDAAQKHKFKKEAKHQHKPQKLPLAGTTQAHVT